MLSPSRIKFRRYSIVATIGAGILLLLIQHQACSPLRFEHVGSQESHQTDTSTGTPQPTPTLAPDPLAKTLVGCSKTPIDEIGNYVLSSDLAWPTVTDPTYCLIFASHATGSRLDCKGHKIYAHNGLHFDSGLKDFELINCVFQSPTSPSLGTLLSTFNTQNISIRNTRFGELTSGTRYQLGAIDVKNLTIEDCQFENSLFGMNADETTIQRSTFSSNKTETYLAIQLKGSNVRLTENNFKGNSVTLLGCQSCIFERNQFDGGESNGGFSLFGSIYQTVFVDNKFSNMWYPFRGGSALFSMKDNTFLNNSATDVDGMFLLGRQGAPAVTESAVYFSNNEFSGNRLAGRPSSAWPAVGIAVYRGWIISLQDSAFSGPTVSPAAGQIQISNNSFKNNDFGHSSPVSFINPAGDRPIQYFSDAIVDGGGNSCKVDPAVASYGGPFPLNCQ